MSYTRRPRGRTYRLDIESIVHQSQLNPAPRRDPLAAALLATTWTERPGFDRDTYCSRCETWDNVSRTTRTSVRPVGTVDRDACNGCLLGSLEPVAGLSEVRDRLFGRWAAAMASVRDLVALRPTAQSPEEKQHLSRRIADAKCTLVVVTKACRIAGFDPRSRRRRASEQGVVERESPD